MVHGFHFIVTGYGFWLPNDPRGSWSNVIRRFDLLAAGRATKVTTKRSLAAEAHDHGARAAAKRLLKYPPVRLTGEQAHAAAMGIAIAVEERDYIVHAFAIMPDHFHLVMARHARDIDTIAAHLKSRATRQMNTNGLNPMARRGRNGRDPSPWARNYWCPYLWSPADVQRAIAYTNANPRKAGLKPQRWSFVTPCRNRP